MSLRNLFRAASVVARATSRQTAPRIAAAATLKRYSSGHHETDEQFDARWEAYFNNPEIDDWEVRQGINELVSYDLVPEPKIVAAAMRACRKLNNYALTLRLLEVIKDKAGYHKQIYPYILQEIRPVMEELGLSTPEELGLDQPDKFP